MYTDSHAHLNTSKLFANRKDYIVEFEKIGGTMLVNAWADDEYNYNWIEIAKKYNENNWKIFVKATIGFHPYEVVCKNITEENLEQKMSELKKMYLENKRYIVAIWECGIDTHYDWELNIKLQQKVLKIHCDLAVEFGLPIVIHSRDDFNSTIEILKEYTDLKIYFHCRWYGPNEIKILQKMFENLWIGFCGNISYPKAQNIRDSLAIVDRDKILLETDAPYLPPQQFRGKTNYPAYVKYVYDFVAIELKLENTELTKIIKDNFDRIYLQ